MIIYDKAFKLFKERGYNTTRLRNENIITQAALTSMRHNAHVNTKSIERLCIALDCQPGDLMEYVPPEDSGANE